MKIVLSMFVHVTSIACYLIIAGCYPEEYVSLDCTSQEVQLAITTVNLGIGEGKYDRAMVVRGKDPILLATCIVASNTWASILCKGESIQNDSVMLRKKIIKGDSIGIPLGCCRISGIVYYGFLNNTNKVYLIVENFGDKGGKFSKGFWEQISKHIK